MHNVKSNGLAGIQYGGEPGSTKDCINAVTRLLQSNVSISKVQLLTYDGEHALLLTVDCGDRYAVKAGFSSGYAGEGPKGLSYTLALLEAYDVAIEEVEISAGILERLQVSALTTKDLEVIEHSRAVLPSRWRDYIFELHEDLEGDERLWDGFVPVVPFAIVDPRLSDLAKNFWSDPDQRLMSAFRRLEDIVRKRTGSLECGRKLFSEAFKLEGGLLGWPNLDPSEETGRVQLFAGTYMAYRNPRAHSESIDDSGKLLAEFLLVNHLFRLESEAVERVKTSRNS